MSTPVPVPPIETAQTIQKMLQSTSIEQLAKQTRKTKDWIEKTLSLLRLHHLVQSMVDDGEINLGNAYILAKLPLLLQLSLREKAKMMTKNELSAHLETLP